MVPVGRSPASAYISSNDHLIIRTCDLILGILGVCLFRPRE